MTDDTDTGFADELATQGILLREALRLIEERMPGFSESLARRITDPDAVTERSDAGIAEALDFAAEELRAAVTTRPRR